jgi:hypothetical protein
MKYALSILTALMIWGCSGCAPVHSDYRSLSTSDVSKSVFKIVANMEVIAQGDETKRVINGGWSGTAWTVKVKDGNSFLMTAGHVCESGKTYTQVGFFGDKTVYDIKSVTYKLLTPDDVTITGVTVIADNDDDDLCLISVAGQLGKEIPLATEDPPYAAEGYYIGAPKGIWGGGIAGYYQTHFSGRGTPFGNGKEALAFSTASAAPGASGSPYMYNGKAVALLNLGHGGFMTFSTGVPHEVIDAFVKKAMHVEPKE